MIYRPKVEIGLGCLNPFRRGVVATGSRLGMDRLFASAARPDATSAGSGLLASVVRGSIVCSEAYKTEPGTVALLQQSRLALAKELRPPPDSSS